MIHVPSLLLAEHAENDARKDFDTVERIAIGKAIEDEIKAQGERRGNPNLSTKSMDGPISVNLPQLETDGQKTREIAAKAAGFGSETDRDQKSYLRGKRYQAEKLTKAEAGAIGGASKAQDDPCLESTSTAERLATQYGVSPATIKRDCCKASTTSAASAFMSSCILRRRTAGTMGISTRAESQGRRKTFPSAKATPRTPPPPSAPPSARFAIKPACFSLQQR